jgi:hypothetical protein
MSMGTSPLSVDCAALTRRGEENLGFLRDDRVHDSVGEQRPRVRREDVADQDDLLGTRRFS